MPNLKKKRDLSLFAEKMHSIGLQPIPHKADKKPFPAGYNTKPFAELRNHFAHADKIGAYIGGDGFHVIDFDAKKPEQRDRMLAAYDEACEVIKFSGLDEFFLFAETPSKARHIYFKNRTYEREGDLALARYPDGSKMVEMFRKQAIIIPPSDGYTLIGGGDFCELWEQLPEIPENELAPILGVCGAMDEGAPDAVVYSDGLEILFAKGWQKHSQCGKVTKLTRPGKDVKEGYSATYGLKEGMFYAFSSDGVIQERKPYFEKDIRKAYNVPEPPIEIIDQDDEVFVDGSYPISYLVLAECGNPYITQGEICTLIGKAKSRKSFFSYALIAASQSDEPIMGLKRDMRSERGTCIIFDTEQGKHHIQRGLKAIRAINPDAVVRAYSLRTYRPEERLEMIKKRVSENPDANLILVDGARDLLFDINSSEESMNLVSDLMKLAELSKIAVVCVLHENKKDTNARGHIGTELVNRSSAVVRVSKDEKMQHISYVEMVASRDEHPPEIAFMLERGGDGVHPVQIETERVKKGVGLNLFPQYTPETHFGILESAFKSKSTRTNKELTTVLHGKYKAIGADRVSFPEIRMLMEGFEDLGWICKPNPRGGYILGEKKNTLDFGSDE